jgi:hypothetical protein
MPTTLERLRIAPSPRAGIALATVAALMSLAWVAMGAILSVVDSTIPSAVVASLGLVAVVIMSLAVIPLLLAVIALFPDRPLPPWLVPLVVALLLVQPLWQLVRAALNAALSTSPLIILELAMVVPQGVAVGLLASALVRRGGSARRASVVGAFTLGFVGGALATFLPIAISVAAIVVGVALRRRQKAAARAVTPPKRPAARAR